MARSSILKQTDREWTAMNCQIPAFKKLFLALASYTLSALLISCSTEDITFEPSQQAVETEISNEIENTEESVEADPEETLVFIEPTPTISTVPPGNDGVLDELDCANPKDEIAFHWGTDSGDGFENSIYGPYLLKDARTGVHPDYDRFVLEFEQDPDELDGAPDSFQILWSSGTPESMGSGEPITIQGTHTLEIYLLGYGYSRDDLAEPSQAPTVLTPTRTSNLRQAIWDGEFEGVLHWILGVEYKTDFRVLSISNPPRLVIDICKSSAG